MQFRSRRDAAGLGRLQPKIVLRCQWTVNEITIAGLAA